MKFYGQLHWAIIAVVVRMFSDFLVWKLSNTGSGSKSAHMQENILFKAKSKYILLRLSITDC